LCEWGVMVGVVVVLHGDTNDKAALVRCCIMYCSSSWSVTVGEGVWDAQCPLCESGVVASVVVVDDMATCELGVTERGPLW
jgi:hypothetical protein